MCSACSAGPYPQRVDHYTEDNRECVVCVSVYACLRLSALLFLRKGTCESIFFRSFSRPTSSTVLFRMLLGLPKDVNLLIFSFLGPSDIAKVALCNRALAGLTKEETLWKLLCEREGVVDSKLPELSAFCAVIALIELTLLASAWRESFQRSYSTSITMH